jgi:hypothetical protein
MGERTLEPWEEAFCRHVAEGYNPENVLQAYGLHSEVAAILGASTWERPEIRARVAELRPEMAAKRKARVDYITNALKRLVDRGMVLGDTKSVRLALGLLGEIRETAEQEEHEGWLPQPPPSLETLKAMAASIAACGSALGMADVAAPPGAPLDLRPANANPAGTPARRKPPSRRRRGGGKPPPSRPD